MINAGGFNELKIGAIVTLDGSFLPWISLSVTNKNYYLSDSYQITLSLYKDAQFGLAFWANIPVGEIKIYMGYPTVIESFTTEDLELLFTGVIDVIDIDLAQGTVVLTGRDYSSLLIDKKITQSYANQTASEVATKFATENNLTPVVTKTTTPIGTYSNSYNQTVNSSTEWDFLTSLAQNEKFNLYVINKELHFEPKVVQDRTPFEINWKAATFLTPSPVSNTERLTLSRTLTLAQDVEVKIRSNSQTTGKSFVATATSKHIKGAPITKKQKYVYSFPNLSVLQAKARAQSLLAEITQHEVLLTATLPPNFKLTKVTPLQVMSTETPFDQTFYLDSIIRSISASGATMKIEAKNHDTNTQTVET